MSAPVETAIQSTEIEGLVQLFQVDLSVITAGAPTLFLTPLVHESDETLGDLVSWGGQVYTPTPMEADGWQAGGDGALAQPTLRVGNVGGQLHLWVWSGQDMLGAQVTRIETLRRYLDGGSDPDPAAYFSLERYRVAQKIAHRPDVIEFRLASFMDQPDAKIPRRQALRDCQLRYRVWTGAAWDYTAATCPYVGAGMWDFNNDATANETEDLCRKDLLGCKLRFAGSNLPMTGFPGLSRRR